jgi:hypothetical protein
MIMKVLTILFLFVSSLTYSQKKVQVKSKVDIVYENFQDTVFSGYQNSIFLKGVSDLKGITVEAIGGSVTLIDKVKKQYNVIPGRVKSIEIVVKKGGKEILRKKAVVSVLQGEQLEYLKKKNSGN